MTTSVVSVTEFKAHCLDVIRQVERGAACVELTRRGKVVARLVPAETAAQADAPWLSLRGLGALHAQPEESVLDAAEFDAARCPRSPCGLPYARIARTSSFPFKGKVGMGMG